MKYDRKLHEDESITLQMLDDDSLLLATIEWRIGAALHEAYQLSISYKESRGKTLDIVVRDDNISDLESLAELLLPKFEEYLK